MSLLFERYLVWFVILFASCSLPVLLFISAPYGRHLRPGWGPLVPATWGWVIMEAPSPICYGLVFWHFYSNGTSDDDDDDDDDHKMRMIRFAALGLWQLHYVYRSFVFPFLMRGGNTKKKPLLTVAMAFCFNVANGSINGYGAAILMDEEENRRWMRYLGFALFAIGWWINQDSDRILRNLRKENETGYYIPYGGLYKYISSPNYFGELVEWLGYSLVVNMNAPSLAFVYCTSCFLAPRASSHHEWYRNKFEDYPADRKILIPFIW